MIKTFKFIRSRVGGNRDGCQKISADIPEIELESTLIFESRFESGNLMKAVKMYKIILKQLLKIKYY